MTDPLLIASSIPSFTPDTLVSFVEQEREVLRESERLERELDVETLVERGIAIDGLTVVRAFAGGFVLQCGKNESRLRIGDRIELTSGPSRFTATLSDMHEQGREIHVVPTGKGTWNVSKGPWMARLLAVDVCGLVLAALGQLQPGAPGWWLVRALSGQVPTPYGRKRRVAMTSRHILNDIVADSKLPLDETQRVVLELAAELPPLLLIQGPPGTGKTQVLALVAETCSRLGKRTLIVAPTHQAVNNALSAVKSRFPGRRTLKVGDELHRDSLNRGVETALFEDGNFRSPVSASSDTITGMTFLSALHHLVLRRSALAPNVMLIEEAGQLPLAHGACAGLVGAGSIFLFGDDAQMPPVFLSPIDRDPLALSVFAQIRATQVTTPHMLATTYRLNADLCDVIGRTFYPTLDNSLLRSSATSRDRVFPVQISERASESPGVVAAVLSPSAAFVVVESPVGHDYQSNPIEARFVAELSGMSLKAGLNPDDVAVVTPFRKQAAMIRGMLQAQLPPGMQMTVVDTVERVQGLTVEMVVLSLCISDIGYAQHMAPFVLSLNRLNVAISRARTKAVLIASTSLLALDTFKHWSRLQKSACHRIPL